VILIISHAEDEHAKAVLSALERRGAAATLLDLADFPQKIAIEVYYGGSGGHRYVLHILNRPSIDLDACRAVWWRRPQGFTLHPDVQDRTFQNFAYAEAVEAFTGLWQTLDAFWVNQPSSDANAHRKLYQLRVAQEVGLTIPETLTTSHPDRALEFVRKSGIGNTIYKAFSGTREAWRETRLLRQEELALIHAVQYAPVIFQRYVEAVFDLRVTIVGDEIFPAAVYSQESAYPVDFRMDMSQTRVEPHEMPAEVVDRLRRFMRRLGIVYGAVDMRLNPEGEYVFLEVNPAGQWLFIEARSGLPITESVARLLAAGAISGETPRGIHSIT
jgi:glutathione synthase/RimK-type ligase-like ATP-grasp enzyme